MKPHPAILTGLALGVIFILLLAQGCRKEPKTVYPQQAVRECDSAYYYSSERLLWAIASADLILSGIAELVARESLRYPDSILKVMQASRKVAEENEKRVSTGRAPGKAYGDDSVEPNEDYIHSK